MTRYTAARARFESWAGLDAPRLPSELVDAMQVSLARWQVRNFGPQSDERFALGVVEECGELAASVDFDAAFDALGDICVFAGQLAINNRLAIGPLIDSKRSVDNGHANLMDAAGRLAHVVLKRAQRIRGGACSVEEYRAAVAERIAALVDEAAYAFDRDYLDGGGGSDPAAVYCAVGTKVLARNWTANPTTGAAAPEDHHADLPELPR